MSLPKLPTILYARYQDDDEPWINTNAEIDPLIEEYGTEYRIAVYELKHYVKAKSEVKTTVVK